MTTMRAGSSQGLCGRQRHPAASAPFLSGVRQGYIVGHQPKGIALTSVLIPTSNALPDLAAEPLSAEALDYARAATAANTARAYKAAWADFTGWCDAAGRAALPAAPETVGSFLATRASILKASTLSLRLAAISQAHRIAGHRLDAGHPAIRKTMQGIRAVHGSAARKKDTATGAVIRDAVDGLAKRPGLRPLRDRALLLAGFAAALRRSEAVALDAADLAFVPDRPRRQRVRSREGRAGWSPR